ncbi:GNAT family N-acetyltransferase [Dryocola clanedunensis]
MGITAPELLRAEHVTAEFNCSESTLDEWLKRKALKNQVIGASRTFVVCEAGNKRVVGFYALATGSVERASVPGLVRRNMPDPIPVCVLGRLAVDASFHGQKIGVALLKDAVLRTRQVSQHVGMRALLVHALSDNAKAFYQRFGFIESGLQPSTLLLPLW